MTDTLGEIKPSDSGDNARVAVRLSTGSIKTADASEKQCLARLAAALPRFTYHRAQGEPASRQVLDRCCCEVVTAQAMLAAR